MGRYPAPQLAPAVCINDDRPDAATAPQLAVSLDLCLHRLFPTPLPFERGVGGA